MSVFTDPAHLGKKHIAVSVTKRKLHCCKKIIVHIYSAIDHIISRMEWTDHLSGMSVFVPHNLPSTEDELSTYGKEQISQLTTFYGVVQKVNCDGQEGVYQPDVDSEDTEAEWKLFQWVIFTHYNGISIYQVLSN